MIDLETTDLSTLRATLSTSKGDMIIRFHPEQAPGHVHNFAKLAQDGFYDELAFHRIIRNFMIQGGCPHTRDGATGTPGTGGPGHTLDAEFSDLEHRRGALSMARAGDPNSAGSQFFIVHAEQCKQLDGDYTVFGQIVEGLDVLDEIANVELDFGEGGERSRPRERVSIESVRLEIVEVEEDAGTEPAPPDSAPPDAVPPDAVPPDAVAPDAVPPDAVAPDEEATG